MDPVLALWTVSVEHDRHAVILPDGCRDLISLRSPGQEDRVLVTRLDDGARVVRLRQGDRLTGLRLRPGAQIDTQGLARALAGRARSGKALRACVEGCVFVDAAVTEALDGLAQDVDSVTRAAALVGVTPRTFHRHVRRSTGRSPHFWLRLARVRRCARGLSGAPSLAGAAAEFGYADQAHMTREFRRWLGVTPAALRDDLQRVALLHQPGFG